MPLKITPAQTHTAIIDVRHYTWGVMDEVWRYIKLQGPILSHLSSSADPYDLDQQRRSSQSDHSLVAILELANKWYVSHSRRALPREVRRELKNQLDPHTRDVVRCLRNLRAHWEENRHFFESPEIIVPPERHDAVWFKQNFPDSTPWSSGFGVGIGYYIGGPEVLNLNTLLVEAGEAETVINNYVNDSNTRS